MVVAGITLIGTLLTLLVGTLLYLIKRTDTRQEKHSKEHRKLMRESDAEHRQRMQEIDAEHRQLMKESDDKFEARMQAMRTENKKLLSDAGKLISANAEGITKLQVLVEANRKDIEANTEGIKELRKTAADALAATQANRKDIEANIEGMKDFRKTAAFQNQLLIKNNRSLGRIEGILGVQQIDETEEPPIPIYDVEPDLEEDAELEEIKERAEMTPDR